MPISKSFDEEEAKIYDASVTSIHDASQILVKPPSAICLFFGCSLLQHFRSGFRLLVVTHLDAS
jgi:hypothetical protein